MSVTQYTGLSKIYFDAVLKTIIDVGNLRQENITILDFGCGQGRLKQMIGKSVINFDKRPNLSDVQDWQGLEFNYFIANHVLYELDESQLHQLCRELHTFFLDTKFTIIIGIAKQGLLSQFGKFILNRKSAHQDTKISPSQQIKILETYFKIKQSINFWSLTQILVITELKSLSP